MKNRCWYCNEELTTANYSEEHIGICTKCYGSMFKVSNDFVKGLTDKIADLEAKLAEKDKTIENWQTMYQSVMQSCHNGIEEDKRLREQLAEKEEQLNNLEQKCLICNKDQENEQLKQQLTDKETEIKSLSSEISSLEQDLTHYKGEVFNLKDQLATKSKWLKIADNMVGHYEKSKQDKISFCIEQLEKVKNKFNGKRPIDDLANDVGLELGYTATQIQKYIDKQIEELKKEME